MQEKTPIVYKQNENGSSTKHKCLGVLLALLSAFFFTMRTVMVRPLKRIDPSEVALFSSIGCAVLAIPIMAFAKVSPLGPKDCRLLLGLTGMYLNRIVKTLLLVHSNSKICTS